ncbi:MAG: LysM peptidoglycan-binding domain-containing protein [Candidatus Nanoarchaeia archaeon]
MKIKNYLIGLGIGFGLAGAVTFASPQNKAQEKLETKVYIVQKGDNLTKISKNFGLDLDTIKQYNPQIKDINNINIGEKINVSLPNDSKNDSLEEKVEISDAPKFNFPNPKYDKDDNFASDSQENVIARAYFGEARGEIENNNLDYLFGVGRSIVNRAKKWKTTPKEVALKNNWVTYKDKKGNEKKVQVFHYSCFSSKDNNYNLLKDPLKINTKDNWDDKQELEEKSKIWQNCYNLALQTLDKNQAPKNEIQNKLLNATNYWVDSVKAPSWAYLDKSKKQLREPLAVIPVMNGKYKAYFYELERP